MSIDLKIKSVIGFNGKKPHFSVADCLWKPHLPVFVFLRTIGKVHLSLLYTPCGKYIIYPLGSFVVIKNVQTDKEAFFDGHSSEVASIAVSKDGNRLASGQTNLMGVKVCPHSLATLTASAPHPTTLNPHTLTLTLLGRCYNLGSSGGEEAAQLGSGDDRRAHNHPPDEAASRQGTGSGFLPK
jgi:hypothetical protein